MASIIDHLQNDHQNFSRLLALLERQLRQIQNDEAVDWALLENALEYFERYVDLVHHPREEVIYDYARSHYPDAQQLLGDIKTEHTEMIASTSKLRALVEEVLVDGFIDRSRLGNQLAKYLQKQRGHMRREETEIFPRLKQILSTKDWEALASMTESVSDPLFDDTAGQEYEALARQLEEV